MNCGIALKKTTPDWALLIFVSYFFKYLCQNGILPWKKFALNLHKTSGKWIITKKIHKNICNIIENNFNGFKHYILINFSLITNDFFLIKIYCRTHSESLCSTCPNIPTVYQESYAVQITSDQDLKCANRLIKSQKKFKALVNRECPNDLRKWQATSGRFRNCAAARVTSPWPPNCRYFYRALHTMYTNYAKFNDNESRILLYKSM